MSSATLLALIPTLPLHFNVPDDCAAISDYAKNKDKTDEDQHKTISMNPGQRLMVLVFHRRFQTD